MRSFSTAPYLCQYFLHTSLVLLTFLNSVAGSETTASLLAGLTMWLMRSPHAYMKLCNEIRTSFAKAEDMSFLALQALPYMNACLEEGMRIFPSIPTGLVRSVPVGGDTVAGEWLPGGTTVSVHAWSATHTDRNWSKPEEFIPERWMNEEGTNSVDRRDASQPFSLGPRGCIGRHLSYMELRLILGSLRKIPFVQYPA